MTSLEFEVFSVPAAKRLRRAANLRRLADRAESRGHKDMAEQMRITAHMEERLAAL